MVIRYHALSHPPGERWSRGGNSSSELVALHQSKRSELALRCALLLEQLVPCDMELAAIMFDDGELHAALGNEQVLLLLNLHGRCGEAGLVRAATLFARFDCDRDGVLGTVDELEAAVSGMREELMANEAAAPRLNFSANSGVHAATTVDDPTASAAAAFDGLRTECLHDITLLRALVPPPRAERRRPVSVRAIGDVAAAGVRGGEAARHAAAADAVADFLAGERSRVHRAIRGPTARGCRLLHFIDVFLDTARVLGQSQQAVVALHSAHQRRLEERARADEARRFAEAEAHARAHAAQERQRDLAAAAREGNWELHALLERIDPGQMVAMYAGRASSPCSQDAAPGGQPRDAAAKESAPPTWRSRWRPRLELQYMRKERERRTIGVAEVMDSLVT